MRWKYKLKMEVERELKYLRDWRRKGKEMKKEGMIEEDVICEDRKYNSGNREGLEISVRDRGRKERRIKK